MADSWVLSDVAETCLEDDDKLKVECDNLSSDDNIASVKTSISSGNDDANESIPQREQQFSNDVEVDDSILVQNDTSEQNGELEFETDNLNSDDNIVSTEISISNSDSSSSDNVANALSPQCDEQELNDIKAKDSLLEKSTTSEQTEGVEVNVEELKMETDDNNGISTKISISNSENVENVLTPKHKQELNDTVDNSLLEITKTSDVDEDTKLNNEELEMETDDNLSSHDNIVSTETSILNSNNVENVPTPEHKQELNDATEVDNSSLEMNKTSEDNDDFKVGDIVWAKIGKYPYWPSVICIDPESKLFVKEVKRKKMLHVRFCNDKGRRSWTKIMENYCGKSNLLLKHPNCLAYIKNNRILMNSWNLAVEEADHLLTLDDRETRMLTFFNTFMDLDNVHNLTSSSINSTEDAVTTTKVRTYSRKRSLTLPEQYNNSKIMKIEDISVNGSTSSKSIDIPLLSKSDDADSTVSDMSMNYNYMQDISSKMKKKTTKNRSCTKTYPAKTSLTDKYDLFDSMETSPDYTDDNSLLSDNHDESINYCAVSTRRITEQRKREIMKFEELLDEDDITLPHSRRSSTKTTSSKSSSSSKTITARNKSNSKESSTGR